MTTTEMNPNAGQPRPAGALRSVALIAAIALTATVILSTPVSMGEVSLNTVERLTLCALLALPSFAPFLFPEIYRTLDRARAADKANRSDLALLALSLALAFLPGIARELVAILFWPAFALTSAKEATMGRSARNVGAKSSFGPIGTLGIFFMLLLGITLAETQVACGMLPENLVQGSTSLCLLMLACIPLTCLFWNKSAAAKAGTFLCAVSIALLLARGHTSKTAFNASLLTSVGAIALLLKAMIGGWKTGAPHSRETSEHIFYALCTVPSFTAIAHLFLSAFLTGEDAAVIDQGGLLLALAITIALACSAFFLWLAGRKTVCGQSPRLPGSDTDEPGPDRPLQEIEAALDTGTFTPQELKVAALLCAEMSLATIAEDIGVTKSTVGTYAKRIYTKLGVQTQAEALLTLKALAEDDAEAEMEKGAVDLSFGQSTGADALCKTLPLICSTALVLLMLLLQELLGELLNENGRVTSVPSSSLSGSPLILLTCLICILAVLAVFSLYRARRTTAPEICLTALLALSLAYGSFLPGNKTTGADALFLSGPLHTAAACCCAMCILAVAQRLPGASRKELGVLALTTACALALRQIPGIAGVLDLLALIGAVLVICLMPLEQGKTAFPFSMVPPLKSLVAMPFIGLSVYIAVYAGNVIAQQCQPAATLLPLASLVILFVTAIQTARLAAALEEPIYPLVTLCMVTAFPGFLFGSACVIGHPVGTAPLLLLMGVAVLAGYAPLAHRDAQLLLQRKELATKTDDEFLQRALIAHGLTGSEAHVAALTAASLSPAAIAKELTVSPNTVKTHLRHARGKLDVHRKDGLTKAVAEIYRQSVDRLTAAGEAPGRG